MTNVSLQRIYCLYLSYEHQTMQVKKLDALYYVHFAV